MRIALVGYGEVGRIFGAALVRAGADGVAAFDIRIGEADWTAVARKRAGDDGVTLVTDTRAAVAKASLVISAVTAAQASTAAREIARTSEKDAVVLDVNSASPRTRRECAAMIEAAGARFVEAAVMAAVPPKGIRVPMLLGGPHAAAVL